MVITLDNARKKWFCNPRNSAISDESFPKSSNFFTLSLIKKAKFQLNVESNFCDQEKNTARKYSHH